MTLMTMINTDFLWIFCVYHKYQRHLRSITPVPKLQLRETGS